MPIKQSMVCLRSVDDKLISTQTSNGSFLIKSAGENTRNRGIENILLKKHWQPDRPLKISIFIWKVFHNAVPVDALVQKKRDIIDL